MHLSLHLHLFFVYFGFFCLQVSSVSHFHPDTRGRRWSLIEAHLFSCVVVKEAHCKEILLVCGGSAPSVWTTLVLPQLTAVCTFQVYTAQAPGCYAGALSKVGLAFHALTRSKPLRFRFLGTLQGHRLSWMHIFALLRSEQLRQPAVGECTVPGGLCILITSPVWAPWFPRCSVCLLWGADLRL